MAISKRQRRKALSLTAYTAVKSSKTEKNFVREYRRNHEKKDDCLRESIEEIHWKQTAICCLFIHNYNKCGFVSNKINWKIYPYCVRIGRRCFNISFWFCPGEKLI